MIKNFINPEGHQNPISGSKVKAILLKGWILPIGGASSGESLRLQPPKQDCFNFNYFLIEEHNKNIMTNLTSLYLILQHPGGKGVSGRLDQSE